MQKYHVYGIGNALVDFIYQVNDDDLVRLEVEKSVMTLIDAERQTELMQRLADHHRQQSSGGSAANTIIAISQLGGKSYYSCKVAADAIGSFYLHDLQACGVATNIPASGRAAGHTGRCLVMVTPDAERTMNTFLGITADLSVAEVSAEAIAAAEYTYIEGYLASSTRACEAAIRAREMAEAAGRKTALTLSDPNMVRYFRGNLEKMLGNRVNLLFCNHIEAIMITAAASLADAARALQVHADMVVITRGEAGALITGHGASDSEVLEIAPYPITVLDTNGAGDMFAGTFLYGLTHGMSPAAAGNLAARAAAEVVSVSGARLSRTQAARLNP